MPAASASVAFILAASASVPSADGPVAGPLIVVRELAFPVTRAPMFLREERLDSDPTGGDPLVLLSDSWTGPRWRLRPAFFPTPFTVLVVAFGFVAISAPFGCYRVFI